MYTCRGRSRILQGRVSNPSERGTGGRAPKAPRGVESEEGLCPFTRKLLYFLYQNGEFLCISGDIYWHCNCKPLREKTLKGNNQKGGHPDTLDTCPGSAPDMRAFVGVYACVYQKTRASHRLVDDVSDDVKRRRHEELVDTFRLCARRLNQSLIGQQRVILIDRVSGPFHVMSLA